LYVFVILTTKLQLLLSLHDIQNIHFIYGFSAITQPLFQISTNVQATNQITSQFKQFSIA